MKGKPIAWMLACLITLGAIASAESDLFEALIHDALLSTMQASHYPNSECFAEGHTILGTQEMDDGTMEIYLAASVGGYGFMGGGFILQNGWGGPCTVVLEPMKEGGWALREVKEIEDYSEIPSIMPDWAEERFFSQRGDDCSEQIHAQLRAYLESIGRTEPVLSYGDVSGELSGMLTQAGNFLGCVNGEYPLGCTTIERLESDGRYLYTKTWTPDKDGVQGHTYQGGLTVGGTTGTETCIRTRKADGRAMETITARVDLHMLTITLQDDGGSIRYAFPYDEQSCTYTQPAVTRIGSCGMDTACLEREIARLPAAKALAQPAVLPSADNALAAAGEEILAQEKATQGERFTLVRRQGKNILRAERLTDGGWEAVWENGQIIPQERLDWVNPSYYEEMPGEIAQYDRFSIHWGDTLSLYAGFEGEEHESFSLMLERGERDTWRVVRYDDHLSGIHVYLFEDWLLFNAGDFSQTQIGGLVFRAINRDAADFDPMQVKREQDALEKRVQQRDHVSYFAHAEPLYVCPGWDLRAPVYTAPDTDSLRAAKGKAEVSFKDWVTVLCREGDWMMVLYETGAGEYRTGWVDASQDERLMQVASAAMEAVYSRMVTAFTLDRTSLFDDPVNRSKAVCTLPEGTEVSLLSDDLTLQEDAGDRLCYAQTCVNGQRIRGFVPAGNVGNR